MEFIRAFDALDKHDAAIAGGKGASLGEMTRAGISVPPGFVVLSKVFDRFLDEANLRIEIDSILRAVKSEQMHTIEDASEKIRALLITAKMPRDIAETVRSEFKTLGAEYVAVRSSATSEDSADAAWAGQLDSYLNTTEEQLLESVQKCWASLFTPRAIFYRFEKGLHEVAISVAVVVQKMVESEVSGVAFSVHPVTEDRNQLIIEASYGLGEAIVSGQVTPDGYVVEKEPRRIADVNVFEQERGLYRSASGGNEWRPIPKERGTAQVLPDDRILELADLVIRIETHYGFPCDIEWAFVNGKFYILQSRPITTLHLVKVDAEKGVANVLRRDRAANDESYELHFRQTDIPFLFTDIIFRKKNYGAFDYVVLQRGDECAGYLTEKGKRQAHDFGAAWLDPEREKAILAELQNVADDLKTGNVLTQLAQLSESDLVSRWTLIESALNRFVHWYRYCEHPMVAALEEKIVIACPTQDDLLRALEHPEFADELGFSAETKRLLHLLIKIGELKFVIHEAIGGLWDVLGGFLLMLGAVAGLTKEQASALRAKEVWQVLQGGAAPAASALDARLKGVALLPQRGVEGELCISEAYQKWKNRIENTDTQEVRGSPAFRGKACGTVKIHLSLVEGGEIPKGSVLIAGMTNPQLVPFLKNAVAIVTDEGGLTCHAAIIARELKIPCIIGAKIATQVFKDGDLVEVDAEKGIVKIIKRA